MTKGPIARLAASSMLALAVLAAPIAVMAQEKATVLEPAQLEKLIPPRVFYRGQITTTELRNSGGVKFADGYYLLASLVDTSGYSNAVAAKFQAYLITEVPIHVNGTQVGAGTYGIGFIAGDKFAVTDVGGHIVTTVDASTDSKLERPRPLELLAEPGMSFRLYEGRKYVELKR